MGKKGSLRMVENNVLDNIRIVLIQTSHPGNIGSTARAMKTMGLSELYLVNPKSFPDKQATTMSSNASDILEDAKVVETLQDALVDCNWVVGSSARSERSLEWDVAEARECAENVVDKTQSGNVALVFGRESSGITNEELAFCHQLVHIPTNPEYSSLNLASAVQLISYECRVASLRGVQAQINKTLDEKVATADAMESYYDALEGAMIETSFLDPESPKHLMTRLRRLYARAQVTPSELNILRGMLVAFQKKMKR